MEVKKINIDEDYPVLFKWWDNHKKIAPAIDELPFHGFMIEGKCAAFLYTTDSIVGILEHYVVNPELHPDARKEYFDVLTKHIIEKARELRIFRLICNIGPSSLKIIAEDNGFIKTVTTDHYYLET